MTILLKHRSVLLSITLAALFLTGCGDGGKEASEKKASSGMVRANSQFDTPAAPVSAAGTPALKILPDSPISQDNLEAVLSGASGPVTWRWERNGKEMEGVTSSRLPKGSVLRHDKVTAIARINDKEMRAEAVIGNSPPRVTSVSFFPTGLWKGLDITAKPAGTDADGDQVEYHYQWIVNGEELPTGDTPVLKGNRIRRGDAMSVRITPADGTDDGKPYLTLPITISNAPPRFTSVPPASFQGHAYSYQATAEDPDGDPLSYSLVASPQGMTIDSRSGKVEWKLSKDSAGTHTVEVVVKDPEGVQAVQKFTITISIPSAEKSE